MPWDRGKIMAGLERACFKRAVPEAELLRIVDEVEEEMFKANDREVASVQVAQAVTDRLRRVDQVAYVRFASVHKQFKTLEELVDEAKAVIDARRFEDPTQGNLFVEPGGHGSSGNGQASDDQNPKSEKRNSKQARSTKKREMNETGV